MRLSEGMKNMLTAGPVKKIITQQEKARQKLEDKLVEFEKELDQFNTSIRDLLENSREQQIRDFKEMLAMKEMLARITSKAKSNRGEQTAAAGGRPDAGRL